MTHLPYIVASYALVMGSALALSLQAAWRLRRAGTRLALIETKRNGAGR
ncbi:hypothetical protein [Neoasaia chiangmaiensis]|nr:hypothetical protein [Neoasaia chiangmaiensis]